MLSSLVDEHAFTLCLRRSLESFSCCAPVALAPGGRALGVSCLEYIDLESGLFSLHYRLSMHYWVA